MKKVIVVLGILLSLAMVFTLVGCQEDIASNTNNTEDQTTVEEADNATDAENTENTGDNSVEKTFKIGVAQTSIKHPFWVAFVQGLEDEAAKYPIELDIQNAQDDANTQANQIETFIAQKKDMIIVMAASIDTLVPVAKQCNEAGIPIITINRVLGEGAEIVTFIGCDDEEGGRLQGQACDEMLGGEGNVLLVQGSAGASDTVMRTKGFEEYIAENCPNIIVAAAQNCDHDDNLTMAFIETALLRFEEGEIDGIVVQGPYDALAVAKQCKASGREELLGKIIGFDYPKACADAIIDGDLYATINQDPYLEAVLGIQAAYEYLNGQDVENPMYIELPIVTKDNVDSIPPAWVD